MDLGMVVGNNIEDLGIDEWLSIDTSTTPMTSSGSSFSSSSYYSPYPNSPHVHSNDINL